MSEGRVQSGQTYDQVLCSRCTHGKVNFLCENVGNSIQLWVKTTFDVRSKDYALTVMKRIISFYVENYMLESKR